MTHQNTHTAPTPVLSAVADGGASSCGVPSSAIYSGSSRNTGPSGATSLLNLAGAFARPGPFGR
jgi:hypothetical protein